MEIISTGDYKYLYKAKNYDFLVQDPSLVLTWGDIVLEYGKLDNNSTVLNAFEKDKLIKQLKNAYTTIKAMIRLLMYISPDSKKKKHAELAAKTIKDLDKMGYKIDLSNSKTYAESLERVDKQCNSLVTRWRIEENELKGEIGEKNVSFDSVMAMLNSNLKFNVPENITVARYCEYKKLIK